MTALSRSIWVHRALTERQRALPGKLQHNAPVFVAIELQPPSVGEMGSRALSPLEPQASTLTDIRIEMYARGETILNRAI